MKNWILEESFFEDESAIIRSSSTEDMTSATLDKFYRFKLKYEGKELYVINPSRNEDGSWSGTVKTFFYDADGNFINPGDKITFNTQNIFGAYMS